MRTKTLMIAALGAAALAGAPAMPAAGAKDQPSVEVRVDRLESEMRAVQRKVFPGGDPKYFPPEITAPEQQPQVAPGSPAVTPVADLENRVSALESQISSLTGQIETATHRVQVLEESFEAYKRATDARLSALENGGVASQSGAGAPPPAAAAAGRPVTAVPAPAPAPATRPANAGPAPARPDPGRTAAVAGIDKPSTADPADDLYVYGYRLWNGKYYPEAEAQLKQVVTKYPQHRRASWAQNLLGRAYLDEGKYKEAAQAFYDNYKSYPQGERTPDSVFYLATALKKLNRPKEDVCKAFDVLTDNYGGKLTPAMTADVARQRAELKCA